MKTIVKWLFLLPLGAVLLLFAVINRQDVSLSLNPFAIDIPELQFNAPLFVLLFAAFACGCVIGSIMHWLGQNPQRRRMRALKAENEHLHQRIAHLPRLPDM